MVNGTGMGVNMIPVCIPLVRRGRILKLAAQAMTGYF